MASSSTLSTQKSYTNDVFLSFRGEDTRKNFVDHLYVALRRQGIHIYKDDKRLEKGKRINDELLKSIKESKFYIIIFSKNYASSSWCLDELVKIMECQKATEQVAYPVFYDVDPSEVRKQLGPVEEAFATHNNMEKVRKWRDALGEATNLAGWDLRNTNDGHEAEVVSKIVEKISLELRCVDLKVNGKLVGMESRIKAILSSLEVGVEDVRMIGIKGIGGGGKTTLARAVFDKICFSFEGKSFVENVREISKPSMSGLRLLQEQILSNVLNDKKINVGSVHDGKSIIKRMFHGKKVLLVLDDVDHLDQLDALAGELNWFKPGSRIIITTRDEQVLVAHRVQWIHDVNMLSQEEAMRLFCSYAFDRDILAHRYAKQSLQIVHYAAGLPLTIRVLGSFLCGKDELEWEDALQRLKTIPLKGTLEKLELSYASLEDDYKEIFLDVACLLKGWLKDDAIRALESCGFYARNGLRVLEQRSMITVSPSQQLGMHDHMEEMGQNIVRRSYPDEPTRHSRLWIPKEIQDVWANDLVNEATTAIATIRFPWNGYDYRTSRVVTKGFQNMKNLRLLHFNSLLYSLSPNPKVGQNLPNSLQFLSWQGYPQCCLPIAFHANNLVTLEMTSSKIKQLWGEGERKVLKNLRYLDLSNSELMFLDCGLLPNLETLKLRSCYKLVKLQVPIGSVRKLVQLDLHNCQRIKSISFIKNLESLQVLDLSSLFLEEIPNIFPGRFSYSLLELKLSFNDIKELPSSIGNLQNLVSLDLHGCENLKSLPQSLCRLQRLKVLDLKLCPITKLPENLGDLKSLEWLNLSNIHVKHLPDSICTFKHLKTLHLESCVFLTKLPEDIGLLESLEELNLSLCNIRDLPNSISKLKHLRELDLSHCYDLEILPGSLTFVTGTTCLPHGINLFEENFDSDEKFHAYQSSLKA